MQETYIEEILKELTLEEKIGMIHGAGLFRTEGVERLSIPPLYMSDGPMGVRAECRDDGRLCDLSSVQQRHCIHLESCAGKESRRSAGRGGKRQGQRCDLSSGHQHQAESALWQEF